MGTALQALWALFISFFTAGERVGKALNNLATIAEEASAGQVDESRMNREITKLENIKRRKQRMADLDLTEEDVKKASETLKLAA